MNDIIDTNERLDTKKRLCYAFSNLKVHLSISDRVHDHYEGQINRNKEPNDLVLHRQISTTSLQVCIVVDDTEILKDCE